jgi:hypothetical protein
MARSTKDAVLKGPGDLATAEVVTDVPNPGDTFLVRGLPAAYSNQASSEALKMTTVGLDQIATVDTARLEVLQFAHGVVEPTFTVDEAQQVSEKYGPMFRKVITKIDELSGVNKEAITEATAKFPRSGASENGADLGDGTPAGGDGPDVHLRAGGEPPHDGPGDADR